MNWDETVDAFALSHSAQAQYSFKNLPRESMEESTSFFESFCQRIEGGVAFIR